MKANNTPEKVFIRPTAFEYPWPSYIDENSNCGGIEYIRTDAFIEKACDWLKTNVTYTHPRTGENKCVVNLNAFIDAMKGE